ncbi:MAG: exodeoxyribonuclease VII large subunit [Eubacteriales bacterium]
MKDTLTVTEVTEYLKGLIEQDEILSFAAISGEISNFKAHYASGHLYFSLKDEGAQLRCVMFRSDAQSLDFTPKDGAAVRVYGRIGVYPRDGQYQLYVKRMLPDGAGALWEQFERLKKQLEAEGLFAESRKRPIPTMPRRVGVITSRTGAAVRDIFSVLSRRFPAAEIVFCPASVQGAEAPRELRAALRTVIEQGECDVIIIGRGGGSAEDLWCFNDEKLVRAIAASPVPVISAVGHETDYTLSDFAADLRAATPSAAAELAVPDRAELMKKNRLLAARLHAAMEKKLADARQYLDGLSSREVMQGPLGALSRRREELEARYRLLCGSVRRIEAEKKTLLASLSSALDAMSPLAVLKRGYLLASDSDGGAVTEAAFLQKGDRLNLRFSDGRALVAVEKTYRTEGENENG